MRPAIFLLLLLAACNTAAPPETPSAINNTPPLDDQPSCPASCNDNDPCTLDGCSAGTSFQCQHVPQPCCGDGTCGNGENECTCAADCGACNATALGLRYECQGQQCVLVRLINLSENNTPALPDCNDRNKCTFDRLFNGECEHTAITPCCGNHACEPGESCGNCYRDCPCAVEDDHFLLKDFPGFFMTTPLLITGDEAPAEDQVSATIIMLAAPGTAVLASEVASVQGKDAIAIGSPCLNPVVHELMGSPDPCDRDVSASYATVMTVATGADSVALIVASSNSSMMRLAAGAIREHRTYFAISCWKASVRRGTQGQPVVNPEGCE
ncbi:MAG: hypothetical protein V1735_00865 [Nanoarchaeota archaeon]